MTIIWPNSSRRPESLALSRKPGDTYRNHVRTGLHRVGFLLLSYLVWRTSQARPASLVLTWTSHLDRSSVSRSIEASFGCTVTRLLPVEELCAVFCHFTALDFPPDFCPFFRVKQLLQDVEVADPR